MNNIVFANLGYGNKTTTQTVFQYNMGMMLRFKNVTLPETYRVDFSNSLHGTSKAMIGGADGVEIPYEYFVPGSHIYAWIVLSTGENDAITEYQIEIPIDPRAKPTDEKPTPSQQSAIDQTISALNSGVERAETAAENAEKAVENVQETVDAALQEAKESGEFDGADGVSPTVTVTDIEDGHRITVTDVNGPHAFDVMDGRGIASVAKTGTSGLVDTYTITYTDGTTSTFAITNSKDGVTFTPSVDSNGVISWTNDGGLPNPEPRSIMGPPGTGIDVHICAAGEYSTETRKPTILSPATNTFYLVPAENAASPDMFVEWIFANGDWEIFGSATVEVPVQDVQVNGVSVLNDGVANVPVASSTREGVAMVNQNYGVYLYPGTNILSTVPPSAQESKSGTAARKSNGPSVQHFAAFYGLAKAAGADMASISQTTVGVYPEAQKSAIHEMLNGAVSVSGTTPVINALPGVRYVCGEVATLEIIVPASGIVDVTFESGSTPTVLTVTPPTGVTLKWANGFDPDNLDADTAYEINIMDGLGVAGTWT